MKKTEIKKCIVCGRAFKTIGTDCNRITCSDECREIRKKKQQKARCAEIKKNRLPKIIECQVCGKKTEKKHSTQKYCSPECSKIALKKRKKEYPYSYNKDREKYQICYTCGKTFLGSSGYSRYCSTECKKEYEEVIKKPTSKSEKEAKRRRAKSQININMTNELARKHNQSYGQYQGTKYAAKDGSILDQPWAQELIKKKKEEECRI